MIRNHLTKSFLFLTALVFFLLSAGCGDVLVPDISDKQVELVAPANNLVTAVQTHKFFWEVLPDAEEYNLRIVSPSFDSVTYVVLDTTTGANQLNIALPPGEYEWNVVALNSAYASACCRTFRLLIRNDSSSNLSNQTILLNTPQDQYVTNSPAVPFSWQALAGAEKYLLQVGNAGFSSLVLDTELATSGFTATIAADGEYHWRVRAVNETSLTMTPWAARTFSLDRQPPAAPDLQFPGDGDTLSLPAQNPDLRWNRSSDVLRDTLFVYADAQKNQLLLLLSLPDGDVNLDGTAIDQPGSLADYYWQVRSVDRAGNVSAKSTLRRFFLK